MSYITKSGKPDPQAFKALYETTNWGPSDRPTEFYEAALAGSWTCVGVYSRDQLVGFGRVISDGKLHAFITEMIVHPNHQRQGIGKEILNTLLEYCQLNGVSDIQLFSAVGKAEFYRAQGFVARPELGPGMQYVGQKYSDA